MKYFAVLEMKRPDKELAIGRYTTKTYENSEDCLIELQRYMVQKTCPEVQELIDAVFKWASRPTKDGAKLLRAKAAEIEDMENEMMNYNLAKARKKITLMKRLNNVLE